MRDAVVLAFLDEPPFCRPADGRPDGCDMELAFTILGRLGIGTVETRLVTFSELMPGVAEGLWTINTPLFVTPARQRLVAFSRPVWALADGLLLRDEHAGSIDGYEAVAASGSARLGVVQGQVQEEAALRAGVPEPRIARFADYGQCVAALLDGRVDAFASVAHAHRAWLDRTAEARLRMVDLGSGSDGREGAGAAFGAFSFALGEGELREAFDRELGRYLESDEHRAMMKRYGFGDAEIDRVLT